jgi:hypothetical protein
LTAAGATVLDATRQLVRSAILGRRTFGGLRGGTATVRGRALTLRGYEVVRGVRVSGRVSLRRGSIGTGTLTVSGPEAAPGTLRLTATRITGTLGGRRVSRPA